MSDMKTYEYIWLDGYTPEPFMRSKVKATEYEKILKKNEERNN